MQVASRVFRTLLIAGAAAAAGAHAQTQPSPFAIPGTAPIQQVQVPAVQTPTISNPPAVDADLLPVRPGCGRT